jgi:hypothetical protein
MRRAVRTGEDNFSEIRFEITKNTDRGFQVEEIWRPVSTDVPEQSVTSTFYPPLTAGQTETELSAVPNTLDEFQRSSPRTSPRDAMKRLGESLFHSLFDSLTAKLYQQALDTVAGTSQGLRIKLSLNDTNLDSLPWEFLYDPMRGDFVALSGNSPFLRTRVVPNLLSIEPVEPPLRILIATSELVPMDAAAEVKRIEALKARSSAFDITVLKQTGPAQLFNVMRHQEFHVLHIIANGRVEPGQGSAPYRASTFRFVGDSPSDWPESTVDVSRLRYLCSDKKDLRLICLSGDYTDQMASQLAEVCPAVIGWRGANSNQAYISFSDGFYSSLAHGQPLEVAITQGRQRIDLDQPGGKEWGMPVCYLQAPHGAFFSNTRRTENQRARGIDSVLEQQRDARKDRPRTREWNKLYALLEIEHRNLEEIEEQTATYTDAVPSILEEQHKTTKEKIEQLETQLKELT